MVQKTPPQLDVQTDVAASDLLVIWRGSGPLKGIAADNVGGNLPFTVWSAPSTALRTEIQRAEYEILVADLIRTSDTSVSRAIQEAVDIAATRYYGGVVVLPAGLLVSDTTINISHDNIVIRGSSYTTTFLTRTTDFGPDFRWAKASGYINGGGVENVYFVNNGTMTVANSPFHVEFDGVASFRFGHIRCSEGIGLLDMRAANLTNVYDVEHYLSTGSPTGRISINIDASSNVNLSAAWGSVIKMDAIEIKGGGDPANPRFDEGIHVGCVDGLWLSNFHIENTGVANLHLESDGTNTLGNVYASNFLLDISKKHGLLIDGVGDIGRLDIDGNLSGNDLGATPQHGLYITGSTDLRETYINVGVQGYQDSAAYIDSSGVVEMDLCLRPARENNGSGNDLGVLYLDGAAKVNLLPGTIRDTNGAPAIQRAAGFTGTLTGSGVNNLFNSFPMTGTTGTVWLDTSPGLSEFKGSATWNPPSVGIGLQAFTTVTVTGALVGDAVNVSSSLANLQGLVLSGYVSATDTVTVLLTNNTGVAVDLGSMTLYVKVSMK